MATMSEQQLRNGVVLERLMDISDNDHEDAEVIAEFLNNMLRELYSNDFFGTEGQNDPRGDFRNGEWNMYRVEGIDD